jgi:hypothetical protein
VKGLTSSKLKTRERNSIIISSDSGTFPLKFLQQLPDERISEWWKILTSLPLPNTYAFILSKKAFINFLAYSDNPESRKNAVSEYGYVPQPRNLGAFVTKLGEDWFILIRHDSPIDLCLFHELRHILDVTQNQCSSSGS